MTDATGNVLHVPGFNGGTTPWTDPEVLATYVNLTQKGVTLKKVTIEPVVNAPVMGTATLDTGGTLTAGVKNYKVCSVDAQGELSAASTAVTKTAKLGIEPPVVDGTGAASDGGTLAANTYYYKVTSLDAAGDETELSSVITGTTAASNLTITCLWTKATGAVGYKVYRSVTSNSTGFKLLKTVGDVATYVDDGSDTITATDPPSADATERRTVTVNWTKATGAAGYKVYRDTGSGYKLIQTVGDVALFADAGETAGTDVPPEYDETGHDGIVKAGCAVKVSTTAKKYVAALEADVASVIGICRKTVDTSEEDHQADVIFAGQVNADVVCYADHPAPLDASEKAALAAALGGKYEAVHNIIKF